jgi:hypothetical protein
MNDNNPFSTCPGLIALLGSGETSSIGRKLFEIIFRSLPPSPQVALLETPAGFEVNSSQVIERVAEFIQKHLGHQHPIIKIIPARKRDTYYSPDNPEILEPLWQADLIFMGPGSPSYAVRQLRDSLAWHIVLARHRLGATIALASAAAIAISSYALPVYEIYKVGEDLHWKPGLDFFGFFGLPLVFIPHWNNHDGGTQLDTSRCFLGQVRFTHLSEMLPVDQTVMGLDEKTGLLIDLNSASCQIIGLGGVTIQHSGHEVHYLNGQSFPLNSLGTFINPADGAGLPVDIFQKALSIAREKSGKDINYLPQSTQPIPPKDIMILVERRQIARANKEWVIADLLRNELYTLGWKVEDTDNGPVVKSLE